VITGPTGGLGQALALELAGRADVRRRDLLLVGRPGERLKEVACDLSRLADVRAAAVMATDLITRGWSAVLKVGTRALSFWCAG
jgi:short-subunit dehydrogenase